MIEVAGQRAQDAVSPLTPCPDAQHMIPYDLGDLELLESAELPAQTLVAPLSIIREIRVMLGEARINLVVGSGDVVLISTDLFEAYTEWDNRRTDIDPLWN